MYILPKILIPLIFLFYLMKIKAISRTRIHKKAEIGSPFLVPFPSLKYFVVVPPLIVQDSWFINNICIQLINVSQKPTFLMHLLNKGTESNAFWTSTVTTNSLKLKKSITCKISEKSPPHSLINLPSP